MTVPTASHQSARRGFSGTAALADLITVICAFVFAGSIILIANASDLMTSSPSFGNFSAGALMMVGAFFAFFSLFGMLIARAVVVLVEVERNTYRAVTISLGTEAPGAIYPQETDAQAQLGPTQIETASHAAGKGAAELLAAWRGLSPSVRIGLVVGLVLIVLIIVITGHG